MDESNVGSRDRWSRRVFGASVVLGLGGALGLVTWRQVGREASATPYSPGFLAAMGSTAGASEVEKYGSVEEMSRSADVVLAAAVTDVQITRVIVGEENDRVPMIGVIVIPRVLNGTLPERFKSRLTVEFLAATGTTPEDAKKMAADMPRGELVWFLRSKSVEGDKIRAAAAARGKPLTDSKARALDAEREYYRLVSSQGLVAQAETGLVTPLLDAESTEADTLALEVQGLGGMRDLERLVAGTR